MSTAIFSASASGATFDSDDRRAAILRITRHNGLKETNLPVDTNANIRASYLTVLSSELNEQHAAAVAASKTVDGAVKSGLTEAQVAEILGAVTDRIIGKESFDTILADIRTP